MRELCKRFFCVFLAAFYVAPIFAEPNYSVQNYSRTDKERQIKQLKKLATQSQAATIKDDSNYNKALFAAAQNGYGGYEDINVQFDDKDKSLSIAEKKSIENSKRNAEIIKEMTKGFK